MKKDMQEQDVIRLLERWKKQESAYPSGLQKKRGAEYLALGAAALSVGKGLNHLVGDALPQVGHAAHLPMTLGMKIALGFLSTVIVGLSTYLGVTIYENREALRDLLRGGTPTIVFVSPPPNPTGTAAFATPTYLPTGTSTGTPTPLSILTPSNPDEPNPQTTPTKPGWHYGQTKTPKPKKP